MRKYKTRANRPMREDSACKGGSIAPLPARRWSENLAIGTYERLRDGAGA